MSVTTNNVIMFSVHAALYFSFTFIVEGIPRESRMKRAVLFST